MSGRGGGRGRGGGWRGRGRGGPMVPVAQDEDGSIIDHQTLGPPPLFPEVDLPPHPDVDAKDVLLLTRRQEMQQAMRRSPFLLEPPKAEKGDVESLMERYTSRQGDTAVGLRRKRRREPLTSVVKLLTEYLPEELISSSDKRHARLQHTYWQRAGKKDDGGLGRLDALAKMEAEGQGPGGEEAEGEEVVEEEVDTDEEEEMEDDDYYKGAHFDDDEGYEDDGDDGGGGDDGPVF
ncbi:hypothetical protein QJQ45_001264 [Haematococcus lacustris]|nr:hypothetical protein QJQ45_001264 [Haematococcus lacustris]